MSNKQHDTLDLPIPLRGSPLVDFKDLETWKIEPFDGISAQLHAAVEEENPSLSIAGAGQVVIRPPEPIPMPSGKESVGIWFYCDQPFDPKHLPELVVIFTGNVKQHMGAVGTCGWQYFQRLLRTGVADEIEGIALRNICAREEVAVQFAGLDFIEPQAARLPTVAESPCESLPMQMEMRLDSEEDISNSVVKDGISYVLESRSLSAVVRFIYTPIDGTLLDLEMEINNSDPINPFDGGGITVDMGGREWSPEDEEVQRHFVSCELVDDCVEARWQWKLGDEQIDFLYQLRIEGKTLVVTMEGGGGRATGVEFGRITGAAHPRLFRIPYFTFGENDPHFLCTNGVFVSVLMDIYNSEASVLFAPPADEALRSLRLNGGCKYLSDSSGKRNYLRESITVTASRRFEEVIPVIPVVDRSADGTDLNPFTWYQIGALPPNEESYVEAYEDLLTLKQRGLDHVVVIHGEDTWHDGDGNTTLSTDAAAAKGGNDALSEYLEALGDLGYRFALSTNFRDLSPLSDHWDPDSIAQSADGNLARSKPGRFLIKPTHAQDLANGHSRRIADSFSNHATFLDAHTDTPPWERVDHDSRLKHPSRFIDTLLAERALLEQVAAENPTVGAGGSHWLYAGLLENLLAPLSGPEPSKSAALVDFDLRHLHRSTSFVGLGSIDDFFGDLPQNQRHGRSDYLSRYLTTTVAYGHACLLPDLKRWGLEAVVKAYYLMQNLQTQYLRVPIQEVQYHSDGNLLETTDALISGAYERSQLCVTYENGLCIFANAGWHDEWEVDHRGQSFLLHPGSFVAFSEDSVLAYSSVDVGKGRMDFARCADYLYVDTRGTRLDIGPISLDGAAILLHRNWEIDVFPMDCTGEILVRTNHFWEDRKTPRLRVLGFNADDDSEPLRSAHTLDRDVSFEPIDGFYKYRITLPEWMVEPSK